MIIAFQIVYQMSPDCGMTFRLGRIAKLSPNLSWLGWVQSALIEVVAGLVRFLGGPMIQPSGLVELPSSASILGG